ncbi:hypothetical protein WIS52_22860 [Pseudonocardia nematodicida]|uniref:DUF3168 domain-containing protein n=1 Tax=Pseudonocardia nematodicida TaxID=1206997 RepID=A0ABV1KFT5_9PSEU
MPIPDHDRPDAAEHARDLLFLAVAGDDELGGLGYGFASVVAAVPGAAEPDPDDDRDLLVLQWSAPMPRDRGRRCVQRVCLSIAGPAARRSPALVASALGRAGEVLREFPAPSPLILGVGPSRPRLYLGVEGRPVTTGFDVLTQGSPVPVA